MKIYCCRLCNGKLSEPVLSIPDTPLANEYLKEKIVQDTFPLQICKCILCGHYQLNEQVDPERMFRDYLFVAGTSPVNVEHFRQYAENIINEYKINIGSKVLDIASNDGTLLKHFKDLGMEVLGIDPAINLATEATKNGIPTIPEFFIEAQADKILQEYGQFDLITANNVFAHVPDMIGFTKGVQKLLSPNGVYTFEVSYFGDVVDKMLFDTIYHEHTSYHTLVPLIDFFSNHGLEVIDVVKVNNHGGSIRVYVSHKGKFPISYMGINHLINNERHLEDNLHLLQHKISQLGSRLNNTLKKLKNQGKSIAVYGTPAKATTLMYALGLDESMIDFAVDDAHLKQGRYTPGKHIPILHPDAIYEHNPDVLLILAWNFSQSIIENHKNFKGKWIIPLPELKIYGE